MVYSPLFRDFRHWKRYEGGWAQDLYLFDLETSEHTPIAHSARTERDPMWIGDSVVFVSDRGDHLNLYRADPATGEVVQLTDHRPLDVRWPATDHGSRVVYELGGELRIFDLANGEDRRGSRRGAGRRALEAVAAHLGRRECAQLRPRAGRIAGALRLRAARSSRLRSRRGAVRNLTRSSGAHDKASRLVAGW